MFRLQHSTIIVILVLFLSLFNITPLKAKAKANHNLTENAAPNLIIVGGGLKPENKDVWRAFIDKAQNGDFVIIPSASGRSSDSAQFVTETLLKYGVRQDRIKTAQLAMIDDPTTSDIDESKWANNAFDPETVNTLNAAGAVWFTGGDQFRTTTLLLEGSGKDTPAMKSLRRLSKIGVPIGGTSAGAAIMSDPMILGGDSFASLTPAETGDKLILGRGIGFFNFGLVDQHFGERARLGRLAKALSLQTDKRIGFGIDENTALVVNMDGTAGVKGTGYVTILDGREMTLLGSKNPEKQGLPSMMRVQLTLASAGDEINLQTLDITPAPWKSATLGNEYYQAPLTEGGGMALPGQNLQTAIGEGLLDNSASETVSRMSFDGQGYGINYVFSQTDESKGFWGRGPDGEGRYTIAKVTFDIIPVTVTITP